MREMHRPIKDLPEVGAERALKVLAGRWKLIVVWYLSERPLRLRDLELQIPGASQKVLLDQLRHLVAHGLVRKDRSPDGPRYAVTELGASLRPIVLQLCSWGRMHESAVRPHGRGEGTERASGVR